jgi:conjugal transfer ATP-binding protein TraC
MPKPESASSQQFIEIETIENDIVKLKNGGLRKILLVAGINFDLKSEEEQGLITYAFQGFLNSLDFSIQIFIHSRKLNIENYLKKITERETQEPNDLLKNQISEYREFIKTFVSQNAIMMKTFFIVIPYDPIALPKAGAGIAESITGIFKKKPTGVKEETPAEAIQQLSLRVEQVVNGLNQIGLRSVPLNTDELVELFYNLYNPSETEKVGVEKTEEIANIIAPSGLEVSSNFLKIGDKISKTIFIFSYPRYLATGWFSGIINMPELLDISIFIHPVPTPIALKNLRKKAAQIESQLMERQEKGLVRDPVLETAFQDIESLRDALQQAREQLFNVGAYITIYADTPEALEKLEHKISSQLESRLVYVKPTTFQQLEGFNSTLPLNNDKLLIHTPLNSGPVSSFFPFTSANLTSDNGILYGINRQNNTLVIFDRFSLENANMVIFAKSGSGKSYASKLEILRLLMMGVDVLVIDPENEYENLAAAVGGSFFKISLASEHHVNPFDIPIIPEGEDPNDVLRSHIVNLAGLLKLMLGQITPEEDAILDRALSETFASHDIVPGKDFSNAIPPRLEDLQKILENMEGGKGMAERLYKFVSGSYAGFTNQPTNVDIKNRLIVFSIRDLEDQLRPIAMYIVLNFIWNLIRAELKKRVLIIDEAWVIMKYEDGASFLFGLVKRCRKYFLGVTTITQDVEDFLKSPFGRPIITNSSLQLLLKQAPAMIDSVVKAFNLTEGEKSLLLEAQVGEGLFFAGLNHVAIQVIASFLEDKIVTTKPEQILAEKKK